MNNWSELLAQVLREGEQECARLEAAIRCLEEAEATGGADSTRQKERMWLELGELRCALFQAQLHLSRYSLWDGEGKKERLHRPGA